MGWFLYCIARHPQQQQLLFEEMNDIFEDAEETCTPQHVSRMKYLECCIKETLRLYPSIPGVMRTLTQEVQIGTVQISRPTKFCLWINFHLEGEYTLPAGVSVALLIYGMHHNPSVYPEPESFKPERFLPEQSAGRHPYAFIPFSAGPRNCIGNNLASKCVHLFQRVCFTLKVKSTPFWNWKWFCPTYSANSSSPSRKGSGLTHRVKLFLNPSMASIWLLHRAETCYRINSGRILYQLVLLYWLNKTVALHPTLSLLPITKSRW